MKTKYLITALIGAISMLILPSSGLKAHCDALDGPVVTDARAALESGDIAPAIKWVKIEHEPELSVAFARTLKLRGISPEVKETADMYFFETLVRLHRAGEGAPYTGLKPAGLELPHPVQAADMSIEKSSPDNIVRHLTGDLEKQIRIKFENVMNNRMNANKSPEQGRAYVEAYVDYVHFISALFNDINGKARHVEE